MSDRIVLLRGAVNEGIHELSNDSAICSPARRVAYPSLGPLFGALACRCSCGDVHYGLEGEGFYPACCNQDDGQRRGFFVQLVKGSSRAEVLAKLADGVSVKAEPYV